jgi:hypothetical protein
MSLETDTTLLAWAIATGLLGAGLALWLFGGRTLRVTFAVAGCVAGATVGYLLPGWLGVNLEPLATGAVGLVLGTILGIFAYKLFVAATLAASLAALAPVVAAFTIGLWSTPPPADEGPLTPEEQLLPGVEVEDEEPAAARAEELRWRIEQGLEAAEALRELAEVDPEAAADEASEAAETLERRIGAFFDGLYREVVAHWDTLSDRQRVVIIGSVVAGLIIGLSLGLTLPRLSSELLAAGAGALMWLPAAAWVVARWEGGTPEWMPDTRLAWIAVWAGATLLGAGLQLAMRLTRRRKAKAASSPG